MNLPASPLFKKQLQSFQKKLLVWYEDHHRDLPWRRTREPYRIWLSEVMLQQTRVETVIPYYERFLNRFPKVESLAQAPTEQVLKLWEGLGYYNRARNLHAAAKEVCEKYGGKLPKSSQELKKLSGFGPYTSNAIASIAFGEPVAVVDGNVRRVISRVFETEKNMDSLAQALIHPKKPSDHNQAMMELGARICIPKSPRCRDCPIKNHCSAFAHGTVLQYPQKTLSKPPKRIFAFSLVLQNKHRVLVQKRPQNGRWAGLWEFPMLEYKKMHEIEKVFRDFEHKFNVKTTQRNFRGRFIHHLSHQTLHVHILEARTNSSFNDSSGKWLRASQLKDFPFSRLQQRVWEATKAPTSRQHQLFSLQG